ncbi:MAG: DUF1798 family protein [Bacillus sp. (in: firmicutes)]
MEKKEALACTQRLLKLLDEINDLYEDVRTTKKQYDFTNEVEPFAEKADELTMNWLHQMEAVIEKQRGYFIGERHIEQVVENMRQLSVQAFYWSTSYNRFKSYLQSTKFLLKTMERQLKEN